MNLRLLLDISSHGVAEANGPRGRSGIFRVVDEVAGAMASRTDLDVRFCAVRRPVHAARYAARDPRLSLRPFLSGPFQKIAARCRLFEPLAAVERAVAPQSLSPSSSGRGSVFWSGHYHFLAARPARFHRRFVTIHDLLPLEHPEWFPVRERSVLAEAIGRIRAEQWDVVFDTRHVRDKAELLLGLPAGKCHVVSPGVDRVLFRPPPRSEVPPTSVPGLGLEDPYALTLCTLEPRKGLETAIRAFVSACDSGLVPLNAKLVLVGSPGWGMRDLEKALSEAGEHRSRVLLSGYLPDRALPGLYSKAVCFLFPSLAEGFGFPPLEAMACGCPVLASDSSCLPEVLGNAARLLPPGDVEAWTHAVVEQFAGKERDSWRERGLIRVDLFRWNDTIEKLQNLFFRD